MKTSSVLLGLALAVTLALPPETLARLPQSCLIHGIGLPCWGCGMTRALCALGHGRFQDAWAFNPLSFPVYSLLIFFWLKSFIHTIRGSHERERQGAS